MSLWSDTLVFAPSTLGEVWGLLNAPQILPRTSSMAFEIRMLVENDCEIKINDELRKKQVFPFHREQLALPNLIPSPPPPGSLPSLRMECVDTGSIFCLIFSKTQVPCHVTGCFH